MLIRTVEEIKQREAELDRLNDGIKLIVKESQNNEDINLKFDGGFLDIEYMSPKGKLGGKVPYDQIVKLFDISKANMTEYEILENIVKRTILQSIDDNIQRYY